MEVGDVSPLLRERLGPDATVGLLGLLDGSREEWTQEVTSRAVERFERELTRQVTGLRGEMRHEVSALRAEVREGDAALRLEMRDGDAAIRLEMRDLGVTLIREIAGLGSTLRQEMADQRVELLKWSFAFWVAQLVSIGGLMTILLRSFLA